MIISLKIELFKWHMASLEALAWHVRGGVAMGKVQVGGRELLVSEEDTCSPSGAGKKMIML